MERFSILPKITTLLSFLKMRMLVVLDWYAVLVT